MNNKPKWKKAPEWANYLVQNEIGVWAWIEKIPEDIEDLNCLWEIGSMGKREIIYINPYWKKTIEKRPTKTRA